VAQAFCRVDGNNAACPAVSGPAADNDTIYRIA